MVLIQPYEARTVLCQLSKRSNKAGELESCSVFLAVLPDCRAWRDSHASKAGDCARRLCQAHLAHTPHHTPALPWLQLGRVRVPWYPGMTGDYTHVWRGAAHKAHCSHCALAGGIWAEPLSPHPCPCGETLLPGSPTAKKSWVEWLRDSEGKVLTSDHRDSLFSPSFSFFF